MAKRLLLLAACFLIMLPLSGCWDQIELEQRGFVIGVAIDEGKMPEDEGKKGAKQSFRVTFQEVIPAGLRQTSQSGGSLAGDSYFNITLEGRTMLSVIAKMSSMTSRTPFFEHLKLVIISEKVASTKYGFANVLDYFLRNNDARRSVAVMVAKGEAKSVLDTLPQGEKTPVMFVQSISKNQDSYRMVPETRIGDVHEYLLKKESFVVQKVNTKGNYISLIGAAVMDGMDNNLVGTLNETETEGYNFLHEGIKGGVLEILIGDNLVAFKVERVDRKIKAVTEDLARIRFEIELNVEGSMLEAFERKDYLKDATINELEEKVTDSIKQLVEQTISKTQKELKKDVLGLGTHLKEQHPKVWDRVSNNWDTGDNYFASSQIVVTAEVGLRRIGSVNNTEERGE
ncbi:Ger(x)C family spore germination protein [Paenibacillus soyae]|uniref:Ger(X)C family spore germination protein n=1 Tax=Paenibacillus soyae TaxID=2969249 RepID=A0A9X2MNI1_9BACL|nr:Ger(x)C family spore germination protein [Paenibacillus soyae]MCR2802921.1 Ger(x)C family spore germination protein [Paenibacillus soyae]